VDVSKPARRTRVGAGVRGALCRRHRDLFDEALSNRAAVNVAAERAIALCRVCPALQECARWLDSIPPAQRPLGVVAARHDARQAIKGAAPRARRRA
jgi:hypothetical protein